MVPFASELTLKHLKRLRSEKKSIVVQFYIAILHSFIQTQRSYSATTSYRLLQPFSVARAVCDLLRAGRPREVRNVVNIARVKATDEKIPETFTTQRPQQLAMSGRSLQRILFNSLHLPYTTQLYQELKLNDATSFSNKW